MADPLTDLTNNAVSIWLDDLSRQRLVSGSLADLVAHDHVVGVTTNPAIFAKAIAGRHAYPAAWRRLFPFRESARSGPRRCGPFGMTVSLAWPGRADDGGGATIQGARTGCSPDRDRRVPGLAPTAIRPARLAIC